MIHLAPNTSSSIVSKSVSRRGGKVNYRGMVQHGKKAFNAKSKVECDTLILDDISTSDTIPVNWIFFVFGTHIFFIFTISSIKLVVLTSFLKDT